MTPLSFVVACSALPTAAVSLACSSKLVLILKLFGLLRNHLKEKNGFSYCTYAGNNLENRRIGHCIMVREGGGRNQKLKSIYSVRTLRKKTFHQVRSASGCHDFDKLSTGFKVITSQSNCQVSKSSLCRGRKIRHETSGQHYTFK